MLFSVKTMVSLNFFTRWSIMADSVNLSCFSRLRVFRQWNCALLNSSVRFSLRWGRARASIRQSICAWRAGTFSSSLSYTFSASSPPSDMSPTSLARCSREISSVTQFSPSRLNMHCKIAFLACTTYSSAPCAIWKTVSFLASSPSRSATSCRSCFGHWMKHFLVTSDG